MPKPMMMSARFLRLSLLAAFGLLTVTHARAQEASAQPSPSPVASPRSAEDRLTDDEVRAIESAIDAATVTARRATVIAEREVERQRSKIERETERTAKSMAVSSESLGRMSAEARVTAERAMREAQAEHEIAMHEAVMGEAMTEAQQTEREKAQEVAERERERARTVAEKAREKAQADAERQREREETSRERQREREQLAREKAQEARDHAREVEQDRRDRERDRREALREKQRGDSDNVDDLYDMAMSSIDEEDWNDALRPLTKLVTLNARVDSALYWTAYTQGKLNRTALALTNLARLQKDFPASRWAREGKALELEVRGKSGQAPRPEQEEDLDLKLMALSALAQSDPQEAMPLLSKILAAPASPRRVRERALFVLAQMGSEQAGTAMAAVARGNSSPELQRKAIQYLGVFGGANNRKILSDVYTATTDNTIRKQILNSFMVSGDRARVLNAAKTEKDPALRADAIRLLGVMGGTAELSQMYSTAASADEKKTILQALFIGGAIEPVAAAARTEKDKDVRLVAVRNLGLMGRRSQDVLGEMYRTETDPDVKKELLNAFFLQNNSTRLVEIARTEKDPGLKKEAVHWLSLMNSKESRAYMIELLKD